MRATGLGGLAFDHGADLHIEHPGVEKVSTRHARVRAPRVRAASAFLPTHGLQSPRPMAVSGSGYWNTLVRGNL
jgi:hypothetical protein